MPSLLALLLPLLVVLLSLHQAAAFNPFEQMFQGHQQQQQAPQNTPSDSEWYRKQHEGGECAENAPTARGKKPPNGKGTDARFTAYCTNYLCPGTLACVHFPHHCPCAFPDIEDKVELGDGIAVCVSKGGFKAGEAARKIELARKGLL